MMLTPAYQIVLGDRRIDTTEEPKASTVENMTVRLSLDGPADCATIVFGKGRLEAEEGQQAAIRLGYSGEELIRVLTGTVAAVDSDLWGMRVTAHSPAQALLDLYIDRTFENKAAADMVRELADQAGVTVAFTEPGTRFPAYVMDSRRSVYHHLHDLADYCGFVLFFDEEGQLYFRRFLAGRNLHTFEYGKNIVRLDVERGDLRASTVEVWGESPGTSHGSESWAWLAKSFRNAVGTTGSGEPKVLLERAALRTHDAAQRASEAVHERFANHAVRGSLYTFGLPRLRPGDALRIKDVPNRQLNGDYQIRSVRHRLSKAGGFFTDVDFIGSGATQ